jgi:N-formylmaleamate deformylase
VTFAAVRRAERDEWSPTATRPVSSVLRVTIERRNGGGPATQTGYVDVDGVRLAWRRSGQRNRSAPTLLLAHGITDSAACWDRVVSGLDQSYDVVRYDARGHGASDRATRYLAEQHTADLIGVVRGLRLDRPVIIGHSMGAVHAAMAASEVTVKALILEDPHWPEIPEDGTKDIAASRRSVTEVAALPPARRWTYGRAQHPAWADTDLQTWVEAQSQVDPDVVGWFASWATTNRWRDHVTKLRCPGLLLTADPGTVTPKAAAQARERWPELRAVQIKGAGHNVRRDQFDLYLQAVTTFLDRLT